MSDTLFYRGQNQAYDVRYADLIGLKPNTNTESAEETVAKVFKNAGLTFEEVQQ